MQQIGATTQMIATAQRASEDECKRRAKHRESRRARTDDDLCAVVGAGPEVFALNGPVVRAEERDKVHEGNPDGEDAGDENALVPRVLELWAEDDKEDVQADGDAEHGDDDRQENGVPAVGDARNRVDRDLADVVCSRRRATQAVSTGRRCTGARRKEAYAWLRCRLRRQCRRGGS